MTLTAIRESRPLSETMHLARSLVCLIFLGSLVSCEHANSVAPMSPNLPPSRSTSGGTFTVGVLGTTNINYGSPGWQNTGITVDGGGYRYQIRVTGNVNASPNHSLGCDSFIDWSTVGEM